MLSELTSTLRQLKCHVIRWKITKRSSVHVQINTLLHVIERFFIRTRFETVTKINPIFTLDWAYGFYTQTLAANFKLYFDVWLFILVKIMKLNSKFALESTLSIGSVGLLRNMLSIESWFELQWLHLLFIWYNLGRENSSKLLLCISRGLSHLFSENNMWRRVWPPPCHVIDFCPLFLNSTLPRFLHSELVYLQPASWDFSQVSV